MTNISTPTTFYPQERVSYLRVDVSLLSSPALRAYKPGNEWKTPEHAKIRLLRAAGKSYSKIKRFTCKLEYVILPKGMSTIH